MQTRALRFRTAKTPDQCGSISALNLSPATRKVSFKDQGASGEKGTFKR